MGGVIAGLVEVDHVTAWRTSRCPVRTHLNMEAPISGLVTSTTSDALHTLQLRMIETRSLSHETESQFWARPLYIFYANTAAWKS